MNITIINREWNFVQREIACSYSRRYSLEKRHKLFEFQVLLMAASRAKSKKEKHILASLYKARKDKYLVL